MWRTLKVNNVGEVDVKMTDEHKEKNKNSWVFLPCVTSTLEKAVQANNVSQHLALFFFYCFFQTSRWSNSSLNSLQKEQTEPVWAHCKLDSAYLVSGGHARTRCGAVRWGEGVGVGVGSSLRMAGGGKNVHDWKSLWWQPSRDKQPRGCSQRQVRWRANTSFVILNHCN